MKRLFIGIKIHPKSELLDFYLKLRMQFKDDKIKWVPAENFHITLKFLGDTSLSLIPQIVNSLKEVVTNFEKFSIEINGLGSFKKQRRTNVIWLGLKNTEVLSELAKDLDKAMYNFGFELETRPFKAHLTLGRVKYISNEARLKSYVDEFKDLSFQVADIDEIILFESVQQQTGAKYKVIDKFLLQPFSFCIS